MQSWRSRMTHTHSAYFKGSYQRETALYFLRTVFAVIKQRAMAYFAERHDGEEWFRFSKSRRVWESLSTTKKNVEILVDRQQQLCQYCEWNRQRASQVNIQPSRFRAMDIKHNVLKNTKNSKEKLEMKPSKLMKSSERLYRSQHHY